MIKCSLCDLEKLESEFGIRKDSGNRRKDCKACVNERSKKYAKANRADINTKVKHKYHNDPKFKESKKRINTKWNQTEKGKEVGRKAAMKNYYKVKDTQAYLDNAENRRIAKRAWKKRNKGKVNAATRLRQARLQNRTPKWLTEKDLKVIEAMYIRAQELTKETGTQYVIDHIYPLKGKFCSGLHVPLNLQVITNEENVKKHNKMPLAYIRISDGKNERTLKV